MKNITLTNLKTYFLSAIMVLALFVVSSQSAFADTKNTQYSGYQNYSGIGGFSQSNQSFANQQFSFGGKYFSNAGDLITHLQELLKQLIAERDNTYSNDAITVTTGSASDVDEDEATLNGQVRLLDSDTAKFWFLYGEDEDDLESETDSKTVSTDSKFTLSLDDLDDNTRYYFQAVAEDEDGDEVAGAIRSFVTSDDDNDDDSSDDDDDDYSSPVATTGSLKSISNEEATIRGSVDMNDYSNGLVFIVYSEDEDLVESVTDDYDSYDDIDDDELAIDSIDGDLDGQSSYTYSIDNLNEDTTYYYAIMVEYDDEDDDTVLVSGSVKEFTTDEN